MKVYLAVSQEDYRSTTIHGVYATREDAEKCLEVVRGYARQKSWFADDYEIIEQLVGAPCAMPDYWVNPEEFQQVSKEYKEVA